jgi:hypothetical protein
MNMSYCRFENTERDLIDCLYALEEENYKDLSFSETHCLKALFDTCEVILGHKDDVLEYLEDENS